MRSLNVQKQFILNGLSVDPLSFQQDGAGTSAGLVADDPVVAIGEGVDLGLKIIRQVVVLERDAVLQHLVLALDLALGLEMVGTAPDVPDAAVLEPCRRIAGDVRGTVVTQ